MSFKDKLTPFGFTTDEIAEIIEADSRYQRFAESEQRQWMGLKPMQMGSTALQTQIMSQPPFHRTGERIQAFIDAGIPETKIAQMRKRYLKDTYTKIARMYFEAIEESKDCTFLEKKKKSAAMAYELFTLSTKRGKIITEEDIESCKNIVIDTLIEVDAKGFALCPFHQEKTPSFHVSGTRWYCFGCRKKGNAIDFIMERDSLSFPNAVDALLSLISKGK